MLLRGPAAEAIENLLSGLRRKLHAPHLIDIEIAHVLRRRAMLREITSEQGRMLLDMLVEFPIQRYPHSHLLPRLWELRHNLTAYDAVYVALAEILNAPLLTCDRRMAAAATPYVSVEEF